MKMNKPDIETRIGKARAAGAHRYLPIDVFKTYLLELGLSKYLNAILPLEREEAVAFKDLSLSDFV